MLYGVALMPDGSRKRDLTLVIQAFLEDYLVNPIESFDEHDAVEYARISATGAR